MAHRFEDFELDVDQRELRRNGALVPLEPQVFDVLSYLITHADRVVRKEELLAAVWGTTFVSDAALTTRIKQARQAVGDSGQEQRLIKTANRRGYRFVGALGRDPGAAHPAAPHLRFCITPDGMRIATATTGSGPPFVKVANWLTHLEYDERSPVWRHLIDMLARHFTLVRYDERGCGLSDRDDLGDDAFSLEAWTCDLEAVVDALALERFPLLGISQGAAVAIAYAAAHPERVSHLVLLGGYARGRDTRGAAQAELGRALTALTHEGWGVEHSPFAQLFAARMVPNGTPEQLRWLIELQRVSASRENAVRFRRAFAATNVEALLPLVGAPTLVLHSRGDLMVPFEEGRRLAASIPHAELVPLDSQNHLVLEDEPAWPHVVEAILGFISAGADGGEPVPGDR